jgi:hypothetical protein
MRLIQIDPQNHLLSRGGSTQFLPSLSSTLKQLQLPRVAQHCGPAERKLFVLLSELPEIRNHLMHRTAPLEVDVSTAAMCMIGLLKFVERLKGVSASEIVWQAPPIEADVVSAVRYTRHQEYGDFVELFLREKYGSRWLPSCPACDVRAVVSAKCEACFTELGSRRCPDCSEEGYYIALEYAARGTVQIECQHCGLKHSI